MKIFFICSSLEPGKDGVGDYTRKLAGTLIKRGHSAAIIAINDRRMKGDLLQGKQYDDNIEIEVLRFSESYAWNERITIAKKFVKRFNPDWLSLQYVPFGFQLKGLPFDLAKNLKQLGENCKWHVMFHELSVNKDENLKFKLWALLQINIIKSIIKQLEPAIINTNTEIYQYRLQKMGYTTKLLPLFSNISIDECAEMEPTNIPAFLRTERNNYLIGTLFGSFSFKTWNLHSLLNKFSNGYRRKKVVIASLGKMSVGEEYWNQLQQDYPHILFAALGVQDASFISYWLTHYTDFGILTTSPELASKSGSFMALKEHGVPVVCTKENIALKQFNVPLDASLTVIYEDKNFILPARYKPVSVLKEITWQFINDLKNSKQPNNKNLH